MSDGGDSADAEDRMHPPRASVTLPEELVRLFPGCGRRVEVEASTIREVIDGLDARWPGMRDRLCDPTPRLRRRINVFVASERATLDTAVSPDDEIIVLTAIIG